LLVFSKSLLILDGEGGICATNRATREASSTQTRVAQGSRRREAPGVTAARASMGACLVVPDARKEPRAGVGAAHVAMAQSEGTS
jgi:hypothetical protein